MARLLQPRDMVLDPPGCRFLGSLLACGAAHVVAQNVEEWRARAGQLAGEEIDIGVRLVADDEPLLAVEHRQAAAHVIERCFEAGVELLEFFVALQYGAELLLDGPLQMRDLIGRERLRSHLTMRV